MFLFSRGPFLSLTASINLTPPPSSLDWRTSPLPVWSGGAVLLFPPSPLLPPRPSCVPRRLLVSSEVWFLFGCRFAQRLETWEPPILGDCSPKPFPLHRSAMAVQFRLTWSPPHSPPHSPWCYDLIPVSRRSGGLSNRRSLHVRIWKL